MEPVISIRNVDHFFGVGDLRKQVLYDISMDIQPGEIVILTGPSGSGKTTVLTLVGALRRLEHGSIKVFGKEMKNATQENMVRLRQQIGFIFQQHNLLGALTARENVLMSLGADGPPKWGSRKLCVDVLKSVGLGDRLHHTPRQLSGGQRQRVAIARALVRKPRIILADEPTAALDKQSGREVVELLQTLAREQQCTILLVTHDNRILDVADRILTLEDGRLTSFTAGMVANTGHLLTAFSKLQRQGDLASHMKELSDKQFLELLEQVTGEFEQFLSVVSLGNSDAVSAMFDQVLEAVTQRIRILLSADRATLFLVDEGRNLLVSRLADLKPGQFMTIEVPINQGIAGRVAGTGEPLNVPDPYHHPAFNPDIDRQTGYRTRSILCMPLVNREKRVFAVAQLLNRIGADAFTEQDERRFLEFTEPVSVILEGCIRVSQSVSGGRPRSDAPRCPCAKNTLARAKARGYDCCRRSPLCPLCRSSAQCTIDGDIVRVDCGPCCGLFRFSLALFAEMATTDPNWNATKLEMARSLNGRQAKNRDFETRADIEDALSSF